MNQSASLPLSNGRRKAREARSQVSASAVSDSVFSRVGRGWRFCGRKSQSDSSSARAFQLCTSPIDRVRLVSGL